LTVQILVRQFGIFWHYSSNFSLKLDIGISLAVTSDLIVNSIVENLAFFVIEIHCIRHFQPKRVGNPVELAG